MITLTPTAAEKLGGIMNQKGMVRHAMRCVSLSRAAVAAGCSTA